MVAMAELHRLNNVRALIEPILASFRTGGG